MFRDTSSKKLVEAMQARDDYGRLCSQRLRRNAPDTVMHYDRSKGRARFTVKSQDFSKLVSSARKLHARNKPGAVSLRAIRGPCCWSHP